MHIRESARKATNANASSLSHVSPARPQATPAAGSRVRFNFADFPVFSRAQTCASGTAKRDEMIQSVGPARFQPSCACGGTCAKGRNPEGLSGSDSEVLSRDAATATPAPEFMTRNGDAGGGAAGAGDGGGGGAGGGGAAAPPARSARLASGPRYTPNGSLIPTAAGGRKTVSFDFDAVFASDPAAGVFPGCGEIHQDVKWNAAAAASFTALTGAPVIHAGFPATHPAMVWIEDRDTADTRYGRRSGTHSAPTAGDEYTSSPGVRDMAHGATYHGHDGPDVPAAHTGRWQFMVLAFDNCNNGVQVGGADFITIDW